MFSDRLFSKCIVIGVIVVAVIFTFIGPLINWWKLPFLIVFMAAVYYIGELRCRNL